jgi:hypothetical protein
MGIKDRDSGGIVQIARYDALKIAIVEKSRKLKDIKPIYKELWLILVDNIFSRVDYTTKQDLEREPEIFSIFDRIILISNRDTTKWIDLYPWKIKKN